MAGKNREFALFRKLLPRAHKSRLVQSPFARALAQRGARAHSARLPAALRRGDGKSGLGHSKESHRIQCEEGVADDPGFNTGMLPTGGGFASEDGDAPSNANDSTTSWRCCAKG